ncbi:MAG: PhzF family phenazine biosynthesis protein [bacterium]|nr:PhzF family phenazine biosynthesis protein [bacterium]
MPSYDFYQVDVFTEEVFGGNSLAVLPHADGLTTEQMQTITREMNLSETTFVFPSSSGADFKVRIFTPEKELQFAGHPVVGTHWLLGHLGLVPLSEPVTKVTFELGVGNRSAQLFVENGKVKYVLMDHQKPEYFAIATEEQTIRLAKGLGLNPRAILDTNLPVQVVSTGIRQLFVPVKSLRDVQALSPKNQEPAIINTICEELDPIDKCSYVVMVFCTETMNDDTDVHTRMFAHGLRIPEDPATGSAAGGLGAYLAKHGVFSHFTDGKMTLVSEQGVEMGRPSKLTIEIIGDSSEVTLVRVGGSTVPIISGKIEW